MAEKPKLPVPVVDPDCVPETLCDGQFYLHPHGHLATLTFTHSRPLSAELFSGTLNPELVVRARITMPLDNFAALRDLLVANIKTVVPVPVAGGAGEVKH